MLNSSSQLNWTDGIEKLANNKEILCVISATPPPKPKQKQTKKKLPSLVTVKMHSFRVYIEQTQKHSLLKQIQELTS